MIAVVIVLVFLLPHTLLLLFGHWLQTKSRLCIISWIKSPRVKFFLDVHYAPYKDKHRYWPGLLQLVKGILLITTALVDPNVALLVISTVVLGIATWVWYFGSVFKSRYLSALEGSFILNLGILAAGTYYIKLDGGNQAALAWTSISIAFSAFIGIVIYHIHLQVKDKKLMRWMINLLTSNAQDTMGRQRNFCEVELSRSTVESVSLIGSERIPRYVDFSKPREPLLESCVV